MLRQGTSEHSAAGAGTYTGLMRLAQRRTGGHRQMPVACTGGYRRGARRGFRSVLALAELTT